MYSKIFKLIKFYFGFNNLRVLNCPVLQIFEVRVFQYVGLHY